MKQFFKRFLPYMKGNRIYFFYAIIGSIMVAAATAATAHLVEPVLKEIFFEKDKEQLVLLPLAVVFVYAIKASGTYIQSYFIALLGQSIIFKLRNEMLEKMLSFEIAFFNKKRSGELISRLMSDIAQVQSAVSSYCAEFIRESLTMIGLLGVLIYQSPILAFYALVVLPLALYPLVLLAKKMKYFSRRTQEKNSDVISRLTEILGNIEVLKASGSEKLETKRFSRENQHLLTLNMKATRVSELTNPIMEMVGAIAAGLVVYVGGMQVIEGHIESPQFFSFMTALFLLYTPIKRLSGLYNKFQIAIAAGERIFELKNRESTILDGTEEIKQIETIEFKNVFLEYENQKQVLKNIYLKMNKGDSLALVGDSGGGKSSLMSLVLRFYDCTQGEILYNGKDIKEYTQKSLRQRIAIVTQRVSIFHESIAYNVAYGALANDEEIDYQRVEEALKGARAWEFVSSLPQGMETLLEEYGTNLSGGQRQRIAIARVFYQNPDILILDEATSALDNKTESDLKETLKNVMQGKITFMIAHRFSSVELADKIAFVKNGEIKEVGTKEQLLEQSEEFADFYRHALIEKNS